jgi:hypothetical protein
MNRKKQYSKNTINPTKTGFNGKEGMKPLFRKATMPLFISDKSENELINYYRVRIIGSVVAIAAIVALNIWIYLSNQ